MPSVISEIAQRVHNCANCPLADTRTGAVPGVGPEDAEIMFIGEAPGANEDKTGIPFSGAAGKYLDELLHENGIDRNRIFITNVVKCRPPNNRTPRTDEIEACRPHLQDQIDALQPKLIVSIGMPATRWFRPDAKSMSQVAGKVYRHGDGLLAPVMHPAAGLHKGSNRPLIADNFSRLPAFLQVAGLPPEPITVDGDAHSTEHNDTEMPQLTQRTLL